MAPRTDLGRPIREEPGKAGLREANLPTQYAQAGEDPRLPPAHVDAGRSGDPEGQAAQGASPAHRLNAAVPVMTRPAVGRIHERSTFRALAKPAGRATRGPVRASFVPPPPDRNLQVPAVAYAISRQHGSAVVRNRLRRRLRAAARLAAPVTPAGSYLLRPVPGAADLG